MKERQKVITTTADKDDYMLAEANKMLKRTMQQIVDREKQKALHIETCNRDLQQLHKDKERLEMLVKKLIK